MLPSESDSGSPSSDDDDPTEDDGRGQSTHAASDRSRSPRCVSYTSAHRHAALAHLSKRHGVQALCAVPTPCRALRAGCVQHGGASATILLRNHRAHASPCCWQLPPPPDLQCTAATWTSGYPDAAFAECRPINTAGSLLCHDPLSCGTPDAATPVCPLVPLYLMLQHVLRSQFAVLPLFRLSLGDVRGSPALILVLGLADLRPAYFPLISCFHARHLHRFILWLLTRGHVGWALLTLTSLSPTSAILYALPRHFVISRLFCPGHGS